MLLKHFQGVLICYLTGIEPSLIWAMESLITTKIGELVSELRAPRLEAEALRKHMEDKGADMLLGAAYGPLLNSPCNPT